MNKTEKWSTLILSLGTAGILYSLIMVNIYPFHFYYLIFEILFGIGIIVFCFYSQELKYGKSSQHDSKSVEGKEQ